MEKKMFMIAFLCLATAVSGLVASDSETVFHFDKCSALTVEVSSLSRIDDGEYSFPNCSLIENNTWACDCYDGYDLTISTDFRTVNVYDITATYYNEKEEKKEKKLERIGDRWVCGNWTPCVNGKRTLICHSSYSDYVNYTQTRNCQEPETVVPEKEEEEEAEKPKEPEEEEPEREEGEKEEIKPFWIMIITLISLLALLALIYLKTEKLFKRDIQ